MSFQSANVALHVSSFEETFDNQHVLIRALRRHPLFLALTRSASVTLPLPLISEANLSAEVEKNGTSLKFNLSGTVQKFTENAFRRLFELPKPVDELPSVSDDDLLRTINELMGHTPPATIFSQFRKSKLSPLYQALVQIVLKCLTGKVSGMDQLKREFYVLLHGIVTNTIVDYGGILWAEFVSQTVKNPTKVHMTRFWSVVIEFILSKTKLTLPSGPSYEVKLLKSVHTQPNSRTMVHSRLPAHLLDLIPSTSKVLVDYRSSVGTPIVMDPAIIEKYFNPKKTRGSKPPSEHTDEQAGLKVPSHDSGAPKTHVSDTGRPPLKVGVESKGPKPHKKRKRKGITFAWTPPTYTSPSL